MGKKEPPEEPIQGQDRSELEETPPPRKQPSELELLRAEHFLTEQIQALTAMLQEVKIQLAEYYNKHGPPAPSEQFQPTPTPTGHIVPKAGQDKSAFDAERPD